MATIKKGILGGYKGSIGENVGYTKKGKEIIQTKPSIIRDNGQAYRLQKGICDYYAYWYFDFLSNGLYNNLIKNLGGLTKAKRWAVERQKYYSDLLGINYPYKVIGNGFNSDRSDVSITQYINSKNEFKFKLNKWTNNEINRGFDSINIIVVIRGFGVKFSDNIEDVIIGQEYTIQLEENANENTKLAYINTYNKANSGNFVWRGFWINSGFISTFRLLES